MFNTRDRHLARQMRALLALICSGAFTVALAQSPDRFPDSKENHWAFTALDRLKKDGILVGYPDGLYRGARPATRFELAAAVHAAYMNLKTGTDGLNTQIDNLKQKMDQGGVSKADYDNLKNAIQELLNSKPDYAQDISNLKKLMKEFEPELTALGADMDAVKKQLGGLDERVGRLEKRRTPVDVRGTLDTVTIGGFSRDNQYGVTVDGRPTGVARDSGVTVFHPTDMFHDLSLFHEMALTFMDNQNDDPTWRVTTVVSNMIGSASDRTGLGTQAFPASTSPFEINNFNEGQESIYLQHASAKFDGKAHKMPYRVEMGRFEHQISSYLYQRPDTTPYFTNDRWDSGGWSTDGLIAKLGFGAKTLNLFVGRPSIMTTIGNRNGSVNVQAMTAGHAGVTFGVGSQLFGRPIGLAPGIVEVNTVVGADFTAPFLKNGELKAAYLNMDSNNGTFVVSPTVASRGLFFGSSRNVNRVEAYGLSFHALVGGLLPIHGSFAQTNLKFNGDTTLSHDNSAMEMGVTKDGGKGLGFKAGFRAIGPNFGAPGDWGRIGMYWNPTNVNDFFFTPTFPLGSSWQVEVETHYATGQGKGGRTVFLGDLDVAPQVLHPMGSGDHQTNISVHLTHKMAGSTKLVAGVENGGWHFKDRPENGFTGGNPTERWYDLGLNMGKGSTNFSILFQLSDYNSHDVQGFGLPNPSQPSFFGFLNTLTQTKGGLIATQISSRF